MPAISQCPVMVSLPLEISAIFPKAPAGDGTAISEKETPSILPMPSFLRFGTCRSFLFSLICPKVSAPASP